MDRAGDLRLLHLQSEILFCPNQTYVCSEILEKAKEIMPPDMRKKSIFCR